LATAAAVTTRLKVGNWVLPPDFRNPVLVAREAATLAMVSDNRLELGFGGGRGDNDYAALGLGEPVSGGERLSRLAEVLEILVRLFNGEPVTFEGRHYTVRNSTLFPKLTQPIKLLVAASGPRAVKLAGERADIVALAAGSRDHFLGQVATLKAAAGQRFSQLVLASIAWLVPDDDAAAAEQARARVRLLSGTDVETLQANQAPTVLAGSRESMIEQLQERRESLGLSYIVVNAQALDWFAPVVKRLAGT
jgi:probable F420-dependent oxidoreductase